VSGGGRGEADANGGGDHQQPEDDGVPVGVVAEFVGFLGRDEGGAAGDEEPPAGDVEEVLE